MMLMVKVGGGPVCRSFLPGQLPVLPFIYSQAASISQVVQGLGVLSIYLGTFSGSGWQGSPIHFVEEPVLEEEK